MAAYAAVASLMNNIDQIMIHPSLSASLHKKPVRSLLHTAASLLHFIEGYNYGVGSKEFEDLEREIARAAHAAEDVIESHIVGQIQRRSNRTSRRCLRDLQRIIRDMNAIVKRANELKKNEGLRLRLRLSEEEQPINSRPLMETGETSMVGFEEELIQIMDELTNRQSSRRIISIVGMGGIGKTTLAHNLYHNLLIKQYFDVRAWATVSQQSNVIEILSQLVSDQGKSSDSSVDGLGEQLHKALSGRRYLIILDDLWSVEAWDTVRHFFPNNGNGSRVVLTTRLSNVARDCCSSSCFTIEPLDEHECWKLFCNKAFEQESCPYPELEKVGKEIAILCKGLPLSTVVIGGLLLKSPRSVELWENVVRNIRLVPDSKEKEESLDILSLSYNHLPPHLKPCFLYLGAFKEDSKISVSKMIKLWIAEGYLRPKDTHVLEEVGEGYFKELIDRNLVSVRDRRHNGKIRYCGIHDLVRDLCLKVGTEQEFFHVYQDGIRGTERRLIGSMWTHLLFNRRQLARSCLTRDTLEQPIRCIGHGHRGSVRPQVLQNEPQLARSILARGLFKHPFKHKLLRVWDKGRFDSLVELLGNVNLRYFDHHDNFYYPYVLKLPSTISLIWNLQTIIITHSRELVFAPIEIWEMRQLRHVKCSQIYLPHPPLSDGFSTAVVVRDYKLYNLWTLKRTLNFRLSKEVCKMIANIKNLRLVYNGELLGYDDSLLEFICNLDSLHKLEALNLSFGGKLWPKVDKTMRFPMSLNKLSLNGCDLDWEYLSMIGSLPHLEVLELIALWTGNHKWCPIDGHFLRLKILKMDLCILENWYADKSHFPVLEKLVLIDMCYLEEIPWGIGEIATLELIHVDCCTDSTAISAVRIKEDQLENEGNDVLRIEVVVKDDSELVLFEKMLETEGLTIDNIQLERRR